MASVPLSEDEQRILLEIEQRLTEEDPDLVREVATALFVLGVVVMIWLLGTHAILAFGGFLIMLVAAVIFERNARRLGKAGVQQMTQNLRGNSVKDYFGSTSQRMRDRMRREDQ